MVHAGFHHLGISLAGISSEAEVVGAHVYLNGRMKKKKKRIFKTSPALVVFMVFRMRPHFGFSGEPIGRSAAYPWPAWDPRLFFSGAVGAEATGHWEPEAAAERTHDEAPKQFAS
jgi:hypothetical protein